MSKLLVWIVSTLIVLYTTGNASSIDNVDYEVLNRKWLTGALSKDPDRDPRSDNDQLRPVLNFDGEILQVHNFSIARQGLLVGEGWQLVGGVVDIIIHLNSKYVLYGRKNLYYKAGLWNNILDPNRSFMDYVIVKIVGDQAEIVAHERLKATASQVLIGLRRTDNADGIELLQNTPSGRLKIIWSHDF